MTCLIEGCDYAPSRRGYCNRHYKRLLASGELPRITLESRFWAKVDRGDPAVCWGWLASLSNTGYGQFGVDNKLKLAHRVAYELLIGPIPEGMELDHLCGHPSCVNPYHLEPVTHHENVLRGNATSAINARKTHCIRGHEFTPENTYRHPGTGHRECIRCQKDRYLRRRAQTADALLA